MQTKSLKCPQSAMSTEGNVCIMAAGTVKRTVYKMNSLLMIYKGLNIHNEVTIKYLEGCLRNIC